MANAAEILFDKYDFPDPRGCEYRKVAVRARDAVTGLEGGRREHAWLIPSDQLTRYATGWDGLIYRVVNVGDKVSLDDDVDALLDRSRWPRTNSLVDRFRTQASLLEVKPSQIALLWRLGMEPQARELAEFLDIPSKPLMSLGEGWLRNQWDQALEEFLRGDENLAYLHLEHLNRRLIPLENEMWGSVTTAVKQPVASVPPVGGRASYFAGFNEVLADSRSQAAERNKPKETTPVRALIDQLDELRGNYPRWDDPGFLSDARVKALIGQGDAAVDPLIETVANDPRLTRVLLAVNNRGLPTRLVPVKEVALKILDEILQVRLEAPDEEPWRVAPKYDVPKIRAYWTTMRPLSDARRCRATLGDDDLGADNWVRAAHRIVGRKGEFVSSGDGVIEARVKPLPGEELRPLERPSVSELLARRSDEVAASSGGKDLQSLVLAVDLAVDLARWDPRLAQSTLLRREEQLKAVAGEPKAVLVPDTPGQEVGRKVVECAFALDEAGSKAGWPLAATWLREYGLRDVYSSYALRRLMPEMASRSQDMEEALDCLLNDPKSPYYAGFEVWRSGSVVYLEEAPYSPLAKTRAFLRQASRGLEDASALGAVWLNDGPGSDGTFTFDPVLGSRNEASGLPTNMGEIPLKGKRVPFRVCDFYAWTLARAQGGPGCELYWPQEKRDEAVRATKEWVRTQFAGRA